MSDPSNNNNSSVPPLVPSKKKSLAEEREEMEFENMYLSTGGLDVTKFRRVLDAYKRYKMHNEKLEKEKREVLAQDYSIRIQTERLQNNVKELTSRLESEKMKYKQKSNDSDLEIQSLKKQIMHLKEENSLLQSRLGNATNLHLGDNDANNSVQLSKVVSDIQNKLDEFAIVKGKEVTIIEENANQLLQKYKCATKIEGGKGKSVLSAALQRLTLEIIFLHLEKYLYQSQNPPPTNQQLQQQQHASNSSPQKQSNSNSPIRSSSLGVASEQNNNNLEVDITTTMISLCDLLNQFTESRQGSDDVSRVVPAKIRQQIYAALGTRGFCKEGHPFVEQLSNIILETVGKYRQLKSEERQSEAKKNTIELVRDFVHLYFRLKTQEPVAEFSEFFETGKSIQNNIMEGSWDDDSIEDLEVEICYFPLISVKRNENTRRVLSKAQVVARTKN